MKYITIMIVCCLSFLTQAQRVASRVYSWEKTASDAQLRKKFFSGEATDLQSLELYAVTVKPGEKLTLESGEDSNPERLFIVKEGQVKFVLSSKSQVIGPGSVALILPDENFSVENSADTESSLFVMEYLSKEPVNAMRGDTSGGSFVINFEDLEFTPHERGGIRNYFNRPTSMCQYFEMHVTTLNGGIKSHEPHTHRAAEIVLMISGETEMQIGDAFYKGTTGDIYFLGSNVSHAIQNVGKEPCMYFAFQWQ